MKKLILAIPLPVLAVLVACGGGEGERSDRLPTTVGIATATTAPGAAAIPTPRPAATRAPRVLATPAIAPAPPRVSAIPAPTPPLSRGATREDSSSRGQSSGRASSLQTAERKVISTATLSVQVEEAQVVATQIRVVAESLGGFVEQLSSSGDPQKQTANVTVRVPQSQFFNALERIEALGKALSRQLGSQDVSEQFIDLKARLQSALGEEQSLLALLGRTQSVGEILTIERELARVRSEIERFQGQLNFLERRVDLATIHVSLFPPQERLAQPPNASMTVAVPEVNASVGRIKTVVSSLKGVIDSVSVFSDEGSARAHMVLRVFSQDFSNGLAAIEAEGEVKVRDVREGPTGKPNATDEPDARIELSLVTQTVEPPSAVLVVKVSDVKKTVSNVRSSITSLGEVVDTVLLFEGAGKKNAEVSLRVPRSDFRQVVESLEDRGKLKSKEVREASAPAGPVGSTAKLLDARIEVSFEEKGGVPPLVIAVAALGGVLLLAGVGRYVASRVGRPHGTVR